MLRAIGLVLALGCCATMALAQDSEEPMEVCFRQSDATARLACFDHEMQRRHAAAAAHGATIAGTAPAPASASARATTATVAPTASSTAVATPPDTAVAAAASAAAAAKQRAADNVGLQGSALRRKLKEEGVAPETVQPIVAKLVRLLPRPQDLNAFELDNGQTWEQTETIANLDLRSHDTVTIKPGVLGAFFLITPRSQRVRVRRIR